MFDIRQATPQPQAPQAVPAQPGPFRCFRLPWPRAPLAIGLALAAAAWPGLAARAEVQLRCDGTQLEARGSAEQSRQTRRLRPLEVVVEGNEMRPMLMRAAAADAAPPPFDPAELSSPRERMTMLVRFCAD